MFGLILKLLLVLIAILVVLNIFFPDRAEEAIELISESTGFSEERVAKGVDLATNIAKDSADMAKDKAEDIKDDAMDKISE